MRSGTQSFTRITSCSGHAVLAHYRRRVRPPDVNRRSYVRTSSALPAKHCTCKHRVQLSKHCIQQRNEKTACDFTIFTNYQRNLRFNTKKYQYLLLDTSTVISKCKATTSRCCLANTSKVKVSNRLFSFGPNNNSIRC